MARGAFADLLINMGVDSAELRKGLRTAQTELQKFTRDVSGMKRALQGAFAIAGIGVAVNELKNLVVAGAQAADQIGKLAQSAGVPVAEFSKSCGRAQPGSSAPST